MSKFTDHRKLVNNIMQESSILSEYFDKAQNLTKLDQIIKQHLEPELAQNCNVANFSDGCLILTITNASWNHFLRFKRASLLKELKENPYFCDLQIIKSVIQPKYAPFIAQETADQFQPPKLSAKSSKLIARVAKQVSNAKLARALERLAGRGEYNHNYSTR